MYGVVCVDVSICMRVYICVLIVQHVNVNLHVYRCATFKCRYVCVYVYVYVYVPGISFATEYL